HSVVAAVSVATGHAAAVRTGAAVPTGTAPENSAVFLPVNVNRAERWCGQRSEHARMGGDGIGNALAAAQPGADELVGVSPVDLGTVRALGGRSGSADGSPSEAQTHRVR